MKTMKTVLKTTALFLGLLLGAISPALAGNDPSTHTSATTLVISEGKTAHRGDVVTASLFSISACHARAEVSDLSGNQLVSLPLEVSKGQNLVRVRIGEVKSGMYFLTFFVDGNKLVRSFYVQ